MNQGKPADKPLGIKCYGSIPHLPGSRRGPGDHGVDPGQARICCDKVRDRLDSVIVTEKLDGSCVGVARLRNEIVPMIRAGYRAMDSRYEQHHLFAAWALRRWALFESILEDGERVCGEWLALAHGTRYDLEGRSPFVAFDLMKGPARAPWTEVIERLADIETDEIGIAPVLSVGPPVSIDKAKTLLGINGRYGAIDPAEGFVYRVERSGRFEFMAKWVNPNKQDGCLLSDISGQDDVWNWREWKESSDLPTDGER